MMIDMAVDMIAVGGAGLFLVIATIVVIKIAEVTARSRAKVKIESDTEGNKREAIAQIVKEELKKGTD